MNNNKGKKQNKNRVSKKEKAKKIVFYSHFTVTTAVSMLVLAILSKKFLIPFFEIKSDIVMNFIIFMVIAISLALAAILTQNKQPTETELAEVTDLLKKFVELFLIFHETFMEIKDRKKIEKEEDETNDNEEE